MRSLITLLTACLLCSPVARADEDPNYLFALSFQGGMTLTRYAKPEFAESLRPTRPDGVSINWNYSAKDGEDESAAKQEVETINQVIASVLKSQEASVLALTTIRGNRQGIWAFYTSDGARLAAALEASLKGKTQTPIRMRVGKDPDWKAFNNFLARVREEK